MPRTGRAALIAAGVGAIATARRAAHRVAALASLAHRAVAELVERMRIDTVRAQNVALQSLVEDGPNFTLQTDTAELRNRIAEPVAPPARLRPGPRGRRARKRARPRAADRHGRGPGGDDRAPAGHRASARSTTASARPPSCCAPRSTAPPVAPPPPATRPTGAPTPARSLARRRVVDDDRADLGDPPRRAAQRGGRDADPRAQRRALPRARAERVRGDRGRRHARHGARRDRRRAAARAGIRPRARSSAASSPSWCRRPITPACARRSRASRLPAPARGSPNGTSSTATAASSISRRSATTCSTTTPSAASC